VIDLFAVAGDSAVHDASASRSVSMSLRLTKSPAQKLFPGCGRLHIFSAGIDETADGVPPIELTESPDRRAGALMLELIKADQ
jgi:hypothetical protein